MNEKEQFDKAKILILLPAYNEAEVIGQVLGKIKAEGYENICVIDDGSSDKTGEIAQNFGAKLLQHPINRGAGAAVQTGITFAKKSGFEYVILMDSDGQHLPEDIERLYVKMQDSQADIVIGNRFASTENDVPNHRIAYNQIANVFTNIFCRKWYADTQSGFRLLNRKAIEKMRLKNRGFGFCSEMLIFSDKADLRVEETPIQVLYTDYSLNKGQNLGEGVRTAKSILWQVVFG
jgi:glycosyltransferase involved in cell wall biosynthesis